MKLQILVILFLTFSIFGFSQTINNSVLYKRIIVGIDLRNNTELKGTEYTFSNNVFDIYANSSSNDITVQLRDSSGDKLENQGVFLLYNLNNKNIKWEKSISYNKARLLQKNDNLIYIKNNISYKLNLENGEKIWKAKNNLYYIDSVFNIGIGYKWNSNTEYSNDLEGVDLTNGNVIWRTEIDSEFGWNDIIPLNNLDIFIVSAGVHRINLRSGKKWSYNTTTGEYKKGILYDIQSGIMALNGFLPSAYEDNLVWNIVSNLIINTDYVYFSSKQKLSKIDKNTGEIVWSYYFKNDIPSKSFIFDNDSVIYMINKGEAVKNNNVIYYGRPFLAAFDKSTGKQKYISLIESENRRIIKYQQKEDEVFIAFNNFVCTYSLINGKLIKKKELSIEDTEYISSDLVFKKVDNKIVKNQDLNRVFIFKNKNRIFSVNRALEIDTIEPKNIYIKYLQSNDYYLYKTEKGVCLSDNKSKIIANLNILPRLVKGNKLFCWEDNKTIVFDLTEISIYLNSIPNK